MIEKILNEYVKIYSFNNLYFRHFRRKVVYLTVVLIFFMVSGMIVLSFFYSNNFLLSIISTPVLLIVPAFVAEKKYIHKNIFQCKDTEEVKLKLKLIFKNRLSKIKIDINNKAQLEYLLKIIEGDLIESRPNLYLKGGLFISILTPLWVTYCNRLFSLINNEQNATKLFILMICILVFFYLLYYIFKTTIYMDIKYSRFNRLKSVHSMIEEIYIENLS